MGHSQESQKPQESQKAETSTAWEQTFLSALADSSVVYIADMTRYGWAHILGGDLDGWEATSPTGEIRGFATRKAAEAWRMAEVREFANYYAGKVA